MIGKLKGLVDSVYDSHCIIDVNGVGYMVFCSGKTLSQLIENEFIELSIETHVREDHIHLYGFCNLNEKNAFNILQSVKGVGTKMALGILSQLTPEDIQFALNIEDKNTFISVSGVGKKLAERIITELKDKLISTNLPSTQNKSNAMMAHKTINSIADDAILALTSLGINKAEAYNRVTNLLAQNEDISINELIRLALKNNI
ncbi:MAG: Holliday junction branch migration protein RuvA [Rickettsiales bacterium]|nr:MAG: Holliday junction branch migration protein RuvA [Rickettsiales bacterium]